MPIDKVFPNPVRDSIRNFLLNLKTPLSAINATLQGDFTRGYYRSRKICSQ